jgi:pyruvate dehydrogenase E2 component (dihydrolipoamide acetyltransferase)
MPTEVILPRVDMDMAEGRISRWYVEEGASVAKGQPIFEIETDKAAMEVEAPASGIIRGISAALDTALPVGSTVAWIDGEGESSQNRSSAVTSLGKEKVERSQAPQVDQIPSPQASESHPILPADQIRGSADLLLSEDDSGPSIASAGIRATPLARRLARERGIDIASIDGTGPKGRVQAADIEARTDAAMRATPGRPTADRLHRQWLRQGDGTPLVLLHGFGADLNAWRLFVATLRPQCPVLGIDLPAHGGSAARRISCFAEMVDSIAEALGEEKLGAIHLAGHSLGGAVAAALAGSGRIEARSLFLLAPAGLGPDSNDAFISGFLRARSKASLTPWIEQLVSDPAALGASFVDATLRQRTEASLEALGRAASILFPDGTQAFSVRAMLERLSIPAKIIVGSEDRIIPARHAFGLPGRIAIHQFRGIGHMPHFEAREDVATLLHELMRAA